ncbi:MAG: hypothetical protein HYV07_21545 [Deltaproteobacteria bacterium]|nr:hypothetical protein [Deltaproteobacteria bacterium]
MSFPEIEAVLDELDPQRQLRRLLAARIEASDPDRELERAHRASLEAAHLANVTSKPVAVDARDRALRTTSKPTAKPPSKAKGPTAVNHAQPNRRAEAERSRLLAVISQNKRALAEQRIDPAMADRCQGIVSLGLDGFALMRDGSKIAISDLAGG